jgi:hypothetical protein
MRKLLLVLLFVSCNNIEHLTIKTIIDKELNKTINNCIVLLISDKDCISCFKDNLYSWIDFADTAKLNITALFYCKKEIPVEFIKLLNETKFFITWVKINSLEVFESTSKTTKEISPFIVLIKNNNVEYLNHLVPVEYYLNTQ